MKTKLVGRTCASPDQSGAREQDYPIPKTLRRFKESQVILGEVQRQVDSNTQAAEQLNTGSSCRSLVNYCLPSPQDVLKTVWRRFRRPLPAMLVLAKLGPSA